MIRLDTTNRHDGTNPFFGDDGTDNFTVNIPSDERFSSAKIDILGANNGGAYVSPEPSSDTTGALVLKVRWYYSAGNFLTGFVHYRVRVITRHQDDSATFLQGMEPLTARRKLVVLGDGFSAAEQPVFNNAVQVLLTEGVFQQDLFRENLQAFSVWRVNLISAESPVSEHTFDDKGTPDDTSDDTVSSETLRNTALGCIYNGMWSHSWFSEGSSQRIQVADALRRTVADYDYVIIILNNPGFGGLGGGGMQTIPLGVDWSVLAHEFGHGIGALADEYSDHGAYNGGEPTAVNVTIATTRAGLKWGQFVDGTTPVPTGLGAHAGFTEGPKPAGWSDSDDAGLFEGGNTNDTGVSRPAINCRMNGNVPPFCPVCYTEMKSRLHQYTGHTFSYPFVGDFDGTGQQDLILAMGPGLHRYRRNGGQFELTLSAAGQLQGGWTMRRGDRYIVADFDGDGRDEILAYRSWTQPRAIGLLKSDGSGGLQLVWSQEAQIGDWTMEYGDQLLPADWNGDGTMDLFWIRPGRAVALMRSTPTGFRKVRAYTQALPGWWLDGSEIFLAGDFDGLGRDDLFVYSGGPGHPPRAAVFRTPIKRHRPVALTRITYDENRFASWQLGANDQWFAANWYGGRRTGLYAYNGVDWRRPMLATVWADTTAGHLVTDTVYEGSLPGWYLGRNDRFVVAGPRSNLPQGLVVYNSDDWDAEMLGILRSDGSNLSVLRTGELSDWTLGPDDRFLPCQLAAAVPGATDSVYPDIIVHTDERLAVLDSTHLSVRESYLRWIHHYRHGRNT